MLSAKLNSQAILSIEEKNLNMITGISSHDDFGSVCVSLMSNENNSVVVTKEGEVKAEIDRKERVVSRVYSSVSHDVVLSAESEVDIYEKASGSLVFESKNRYNLWMLYYGYTRDSSRGHIFHGGSLYFIGYPTKLVRLKIKASKVDSEGIIGEKEEQFSEHIISKEEIAGIALSHNETCVSYLTSNGVIEVYSIESEDIIQKFIIHYNVMETIGIGEISNDNQKEDKMYYGCLSFLEEKNAYIVTTVRLDHSGKPNGTTQWMHVVRVSDNIHSISYSLTFPDAHTSIYPLRFLTNPSSPYSKSSIVCVSKNSINLYHITLSDPNSNGKYENDCIKLSNSIHADNLIENHNNEHQGYINCSLMLESHLYVATSCEIYKITFNT